jgi:hypothetical protein
MFVAVFMFRTLTTPMAPRKDTFSDAINQIIGVHGGTVGLWFLGIGLILFGIFAASNAYYKYYPTPPPTRYAFPSKHQIRSQQPKQQHSQPIDDNQQEGTTTAPTADAQQVDKRSTNPTLPSNFEETDQQRASSPATYNSRIGIIDGMTSSGAPTSDTNDRIDNTMIHDAPPSPFEETRRFRWHRKRRERTSSIA